MSSSVPEVESVDSTSVVDPRFERAMQRLHQVNVCARWAFVLLLWLVLAPLSLWELRYPIRLMLEYFTWAALRYGIIYTPLPSMGLFFCIGVTIAVLVWQSRNILFGFPKAYQARLAKRVQRIHQQGESHPFWQWVHGEKS
ncbi:MAG: hypothetical protein KME16_13310 [Scytolyngbya sp. HA4215-MV1]|nr:hypothetical protein [Scytolyngbya sp. HA4215-MV1]